LGTLSYSFVHAFYMGMVIYIKYYKPVTPVFQKEFFNKISLTGVTQIINQLLILLLGVCFVGMKPGGYSYARYAESITYFVFVLVAGNLGSVIAPLLSKLKDNKTEFQLACENFFSMTLFLMIFPTVFMFLKSDLIIGAIYKSNSTTNLSFISLALRHASLGTPFWCLQRILLTFFTSRGNLMQQNICTTINNLFTFMGTILLYKYDFLGVIWGMNIGIMAVVLYLLYTSYKYDIFRISTKIIINIFLKIIVCIFLIKILFYNFSSGNTLGILLTASCSYLLYCLIFYKDMRFFLTRNNL